MRTAWKLIKGTVDEFTAVPTLSLGAATAYYAAFSIGPILVLAVALAGLGFGHQRVHGELHRQLDALLGPSSANLVESMISAQLQGSKGRIIADMIGAVALIFGASGVFTQLQASLNMIWGVSAKPGHSVWVFIRDRLLSLAMVLAIGFLLLVSLALTTCVTAFTHAAATAVSVPDWFAPVFEGFASFVVTALLFALIFKVLPDVKIEWRDVLTGAVGTSLLFTAGKFLLSVYLKHEISASAYGSGTVFIAVLLYVYYASIILYLGAEFTVVYARHRGCSFEPSEYAVRASRGRASA